MTRTQHLILSFLIATTPTAWTQRDCSRTCESSGDNCNGDTILGCETSCKSSTCSEAVFVDAEVTCEKEAGSWSDACSDATFNRSSVQLMNSECDSCSFWFSQVITDGPFSIYSSSQPVFAVCSCCDDTNGSNSCPNGVPSCTANTQEFCATSVHLRTCKDWGNPVCANLDIPSIPMKTTADTCSLGLDNVWCPDNGCEGLEVTNCTTLCYWGSCSNAVFIDSVVGCYKFGGYSESCNDAQFERSTVTLDDTLCSSCEFWFSAVSTNSPFGSFSWDTPTFSFCSCCDDTSGGQNCPEGVPSCDNPSFCADDFYFRTCKDWGNPICEDIDIPSLPIKADATTCSEGVDTVWCRDKSCESMTVSNCTAICSSESCAGAVFTDSVVGCYQLSGYSETCAEATFNRSFVNLEDVSCDSCEFWFSAVTTNNPFETTSWDAPSFLFCSCCDDTGNQLYCPEGVPSCKANPKEFCASQAHGKTCKEWGNPVCTDLQDIPSIPGIVNENTCSEGLDTLWCQGGGQCEGLEVSECRVMCVNEACKDAKFVLSDVGCYMHKGYSDPCNAAVFERSVVSIENSKCESCSFWFSAVTTNSEFGSYYPITPSFGICSCCDDGGTGHCPEGVPSCIEDPVEFCSTTQLGRSCKDWGNPVCYNVNILGVEEFAMDTALNTTDGSFLNETLGDGDEPEPYPVCSLGTGDKMAACSGTDCAGVVAYNCTLECYDQACSGGDLGDSSVACLGEGTCATSKFTRSQVDCATSTCVDADFFSSAVSCGSSEFSCEYILVSRCSCCDGADCPPASMSCDDENFCSDTYAGRTCKDWGHPLCEDANVPSEPPLNPAESCSLEEEIKFCDEGDNGCFGLEAEQCTVLCHGKTCNQARFDDSFVQCFDRVIPGFFEVWPGESCVSARFTRSVAVCQNSCVGSTFEDSYARCLGPSCTETKFGDCSCCDGDGCPFGVPSCEGNLDAICTQEVNGETCACRGFPVCDEEYTSSCSASNPVARGIRLDIKMDYTKARLPSRQNP